MKLNYLRCYPIYFTSTPANTGDGIRMAMSVGADLWHMNCFASGFAMKLPGLSSGIQASIRGKDRGWAWRDSTNTGGAKPTCGYVIVDKRGHRFTNENFKQHHVSYELGTYESRGLNYPRIPSYWIMDDRRIQDGALPAAFSGSAGPAGYYKWSEDNKREIERGWIVVADSITELSQKLGINADTLKQTVATYDSYCQKGSDADFQRRPESLIPLDAPPYYAVTLWPGGPNTQGGPRRNRKSQVMDVEGDPIPGLYAVGELGSVFGMLYTGGGNLGECISFGRIAGENAAKEKTRSFS
jgi:succinate dehydrogenase/fumarate reductase flavoprotein subunit